MTVLRQHRFASSPFSIVNGSTLVARSERAGNGAALVDAVDALLQRLVVKTPVTSAPPRSTNTACSTPSIVSTS